MKSVILILIWLLTLQAVKAQGPLPRNINFSSYAPTALDQFKGTCYAYASTYTALSVKYNIKVNAQSFRQINDNAFSAAFTASMIRRQKFFLWKIFTFWSCSIG